MSAEKSRVSMGFALCPVCGVKHDEVVLMDSRLRKKLPHESFMGYALCKKDKAKKDEGYIALVECKNSNDGESEARMTLQDADRTGRVCHIRSEIWPKIFNSPAPTQGMRFVTVEAVEAFETLARLHEQAELPRYAVVMNPGMAGEQVESYHGRYQLAKEWMNTCKRLNPGADYDIMKEVDGRLTTEF